MVTETMRFSDKLDELIRFIFSFFLRIKLHLIKNKTFIVLSIVDVLQNSNFINYARYVSYRVYIFTGRLTKLDSCCFERHSYFKEYYLHEESLVEQQKERLSIYLNSRN